MELRNTVEDMLSRDYKRRFRALLCAEHFLCMSTISGAVHWTPSIGGTYHPPGSLLFFAIFFVGKSVVYRGGQLGSCGGENTI